MTHVRTSRRIVFQGMGGLGVALALAGCGAGDDEPGGAGTPEPTSEPTSTAPTGDDSSSESAPADPPSSSAPAEGGAALAATTEVPVGGGIVLLDDNLVLVQPAEGDFKAYRASCTHQGTPVQVDGAEMLCPTHGSRFALGDGAPVNGPASAPLAEVALTVTGGQISLA